MVHLDHFPQKRFSSGTLSPVTSVCSEGTDSKGKSKSASMGMSANGHEHEDFVLDDQVENECINNMHRERFSTHSPISNCSERVRVYTKAETEAETEAEAEASTKSPPHHMVPIFLGLMPYIMGSIFGRSDTWMEISFFILIISWLYLTLKIPWDLHFSIQAKKSDLSKRNSQRLYGLLELLSILLIFSSPFIAVYGVGAFQNYYSTSQTVRFVSGFNVHLFILAVLIPAIQHFLDPDRQSKRPQSEHISTPTWAKRIQSRMEQLEQQQYNRVPLASASSANAIVPFRTGTISPVIQRPVSMHKQPPIGFSTLWVIFILMTWPYWVARWFKRQTSALISTIFALLTYKRDPVYSMDVNSNTQTFDPYE
jgi:hypothetical protein